MYVSILSEKTSMHKIKKLFADLCCSECGAEFDENSVSILREEEGLLVLQVICNNCQKSFGVAILGFNPTSFADKDEVALEELREAQEKAEEAANAQAAQSFREAQKKWAEKNNEAED